MGVKINKTNWPVTITLLVLAVFVIFPVYLAISVALKNPKELADSIIALPTGFHFENFAKAAEMTNFPRSLMNSLIITIFSVIFTVGANSMVGYAIARNLDKPLYKGLYYYFLSAMFIPFPIIMMPVVKQASVLHMTNIPGLIVLYTVFGLSLNTFLYIGYIKSIPRDLEEAAFIDGASSWQVFTKVIFPVLTPINATVAILTALWSWNDFMLPLIILKKREEMTLPLVQYIFQSQFSTDFNLAFASYMMALAPMLIFYVFAQKWIIGGVLNGSVKG